MVVFVVSFVVFGVLLVWGGIASMKRDKALGVRGSFLDLKVTGTHLLVGAAKYPLAGVTASVESAGEISKRITATRLVTTGMVALAWKKRKDDRSVFLTIVGPGVNVVREAAVKDNADAPAAARRFAAAVNSAALTLDAGSAAVPAPADGGIAKQLADLAALRDSGALTEAEFTAAKQRLIGDGPQDAPAA